MIHNKFGKPMDEQPPYVSEELQNAFKEVELKNKKDAEDFWDKLSYDDKCNAFHAVMSRLVDGELTQKGSYRYVLYDVFGFGPGMYVRGIDCGYIKLHNQIVSIEEMAFLRKNYKQKKIL